MSDQASFSAAADVSTAAPAPTPQQTNPQKNRKGISRMWHAPGYCPVGLCAGTRVLALVQRFAA